MSEKNPSGTGKKIVGKAAAESAKIAKHAASGTLHYYILFKIIAIVAVAVLCILLFVGCLFDIVFRDLGFSDADNYTITMYDIETENINEGLTGLYGTSKNNAIDSSLKTIIKDEKENIKVKYEKEKEKKEKENQIQTIWEKEPYTTVRYKECVIDTSSYSNFWDEKKYVNYFSPIIQNVGSNEIIHWTENASGSQKSQITDFLVNQINNYSWFSSKEEDDTLEVVKEKHKTGEKYYFEYVGSQSNVGTGNPAETEEETFEETFLDETAKYYVEDLGYLGGNKTASEWLAYFQSDPNWTQKAEDIIEEIDITYVTKHYTIDMESPAERIQVTSGYEFSNIGDSEIDENNEEQMQLGIRLLEAIDSGEYGDLVKAFLTGGAEKVKNTFKTFWVKFQKDFSYREFVKNNNVTSSNVATDLLSFNSGGNVEDSIYGYLRAMGYTHEAVCAIMGNMKQENSTFNPEYNDGTYFGIFNIDENRYRKLVDLSKKNGVEANTIKAQLDYIPVDIGNHISKVRGNKLIQCLKTCTDVELATQEFCVGYEGCIRTGTPHTYDLPYTGKIFENHLGDYYQELSKRINYAKQYEERYAKYKEDYSELQGQSDIIEYALKWVGNKYVWGGSSLQNGIDCSHFVYEVLKNTGHYSGGYVTSTNWKDKGKAVSGGISEAMPGDVLVWNGHVALYMGDGKYVHASNPSPYPRGGIKVSTLSNSGLHNINNILAVRRFQ